MKCMKQNSKYVRVSDEEARKLELSKSGWAYVSKSEYKRETRADAQPEEA